jgi:2-polyprenyl-3-methyl-5-hydroxy-6-metoxy-1,4-benzoquinol methylase
MSEFHYVGNDTLEIMAEAKKYNAFLEKLVLKQAPSNGGLILDIGAGIGTFAKRISDKSYHVHCVEPDTEQSKEIEKIGLAVDTSIEKIEDTSFDYIYSLNVLEHIENDKEELKVWVKKLKPGGTILVYVPAFNLLYSSFDKSIGHYRRYRKDLLVEISKDAGLQIETARYTDGVGFFVSLVYKWINNGDGKINKKTLLFYDRVLFPIRRLFDVLFFKILGKNVYIVGKRV